MANAIRGLVSKKKKRFKQDGFDLDLTYITERVIAMGFPSTGMEGVYRNPLPEVQRFFDTKHRKKYKIYNLCSERAYDIAGLFDDNFEHFGFDDHNPCPLTMLKPICESIDRWLAVDPAHVVSIHCKAGKGRTGLIVSAYLVHSGRCASAQHALQFFGEERTENGKGVTIPSQQRYVHYYEQILRRGSVPVPTYMITHVRLITVPNFDVGGGCDPYFKILKVNAYEKDGKWLKEETLAYDYREAPGGGKVHIKKYRKDEKYVDLDCSGRGYLVSGDVKLVLFDQDMYSSDDKMCHVWFHTGFIENNYLCFEKSVVDKACKDKRNKHFDPNFKIEIFLHRINSDDDPTVRFEIASDNAAMRRGVPHGQPVPDSGVAEAAAAKSGARAGAEETKE